MNIRDLTTEEIRRAYADYLEHDFPSDELKPLDRIEKSLDAGQYSCIGAFDDDGAFVAYAFFVIVNGLSLLDYYAVVPSKRGEGIGTGFLSQAILGTGIDFTLIEIEDPESGVDAADVAARSKRRSFYLNAGCIDTDVRVTTFGVDFLILEYPTVSGKLHSKLEVAEAYKELYREILPKRMFERNVFIKKNEEILEKTKTKHSK